MHFNSNVFPSMPCCRIDPDELFAYNTFKVVRVKDRVLGLLRLGLILVIFAYIVVKVIIFDKEYNIHDTPVGTARTSLEMPKDANRNPIPIVLEDYPFCPGPNRNWRDNENFPCQVWDEYAVRYPDDELNAIFIATRASITNQQYHCGAQNTPNAPTVETECVNPFLGNTTETVFLAGVTEYTIGLKHQFRAPQFAVAEPHNSQYAGSSNTYYGELLDQEGKVLKTFPPVQDDVPDVLPLSLLLQAAGANLTESSQTQENSQLYSGIVLMLFVNYNNLNGKTRYTYRVQQIEGADYKNFEPRSSNPSDITAPRTLIKRAGVKTVIIINGDLAKFDFQTLLIQAVSAMGLLSVATLVVELVMLYILPLRKYYNNVKFEETEDFDVVREKLEQAEAQEQAQQQGFRNQLAQLRQAGVITNYESLSESRSFAPSDHGSPPFRPSPHLQLPEHQRIL